MRYIKLLYILFIQTKILINPMKCVNISHSLDEGKHFDLLKLINTIKKQRDIDSILQISNNKIHLNIPDNVPTIILNKGGININNFVFKKYFNRDILVFVNMGEIIEGKILEASKSLLTKLADILFGMREAPVVLYLREHNKSEISLKIIQAIYQHCFKLKMLYIITVFRNFNKTKLVYAYDAFSENKILAIDYLSGKRIFFNNLKNLSGHKIRTIADQIEPRSMLYTDGDGKQKLTGYLFKLIDLFAYKHNGTLSYPYRMYEKKLLYYGDLGNQTRLGLLDIPISMLPSTITYNSTSYTFEEMSYCMMLPIPPHIPVKEIYTLLIPLHVQTVTILSAAIYSALLVLIEYSPEYKVKWWQLYPQLDVIRCIMDQPMLMNNKDGWKCRFVCIQLFIFMFLQNAMYTAYLNSLLTSPPVESKIRNVKDFQERNLDILAPENEYNLFVKNNKYAEPFWNHSLINETVKLKSFNELQQRRNAMETGHAYPVTDVRWIYFNERQKIFKTPLFYYEDRFCFTKLMFLTIPLQYNSIYKEAFNRLILQIQESGLRVHWLKQSFMDMIKLKRITKEDLSPPITFGGPLQLDDFGLVYCLIYTGTICSLLVFVVEYYCKKFSR